MKAGLLEKGSDTYLSKALEFALSSPCTKMGFGAVLVNDYNGVIYQTTDNRPTQETAWVCEPTCIRLTIPSRTQSMIGACYHAEERAIAEGLRADLDLRNFVLFVAGVHGESKQPAYRENPVFSCVRCAASMVLHRLKGVYLYDGQYWHYQDSAHAYQTALSYALGQRSV